MRDVVYLRAKTEALLKQLYPTGRAWQGESDSALIQSVKSDALSDYLYELETFISTILPDTELFDENDAINWERRLGLDYDPDSLTLKERKAEITRKLSFPGGFKHTLSLKFLEYQLRASSFDVRVYRNEDLSQPDGTELIANSVDKEEGFTINNYYHTFIIAGETKSTQAIIESRRRNEFIRKVLRYKPMNMICFLNSTISKQDGTFKLKYSDYLCELIEETPPYATNVLIDGIREVGKTLTGSYTYNDDEGDTESGTTFQWFRSDDVSGSDPSPIAGAISKTYKLAEEDVGKFISFGVIPANVKNEGDTAFSYYVGPINSINIPVIVSFENNLLTWTVPDGTENTGTWEVYVERVSQDGPTQEPPITVVGTGSPRYVTADPGTQLSILFKVRRISEPTTDWSEVYEYVDLIAS